MARKKCRVLTGKLHDELHRTAQGRKLTRKFFEMLRRSGLTVRICGLR